MILLAELSSFLVVLLGLRARSCDREDCRDEAVGQLRSKSPPPELLVHAGLCQEDYGGGDQEGSRGEVDGVVAERHDDHHVGQEGGQKGEGEKNSSEAEQALLGSGLEAPHSHRRADQVPQKKGVE